MGEDEFGGAEGCGAVFGEGIGEGDATGSFVSAWNSIELNGDMIVISHCSNWKER